MTISSEPTQHPGEEVTYCARHPQVETALRCSRCEKLICPRCLVQTPVGARCKDCGIAGKSPLYQLSPVLYLRMVALVILGGGLVGVGWAFIAPGRLFLGFFSLAIAAGVGWLLAKGIERAANYKRGTTVQVFAIAGIIVAFIVRSALVYDGVLVDGYALVAVGVASFVAWQNLK
ncbi:MAG: B-box zinc finger protein [Dehalococcoidia bacterium]